MRSEKRMRETVMRKKEVKNKGKNKGKRRSVAGYLVVGLLYLVAVVLVTVCRWAQMTYNFDLRSLLYTITNPLAGADTGIVKDGVRACVPMILKCFVPYLLLVAVDIWVKIPVRIKGVFFKKRFAVDVAKLARRAAALGSVALLFVSLLYVDAKFQVVSYIKNSREVSTIYEDYYVAPSAVKIEGEDTKNLIYIYMESMETTYASVEEGGYQSTNLIPELTELAKDNLSFSTEGSFGGFRNTTGSTWTLGALLSSLSGVPYAFPVEGNSMGAYQNFASGLTTLGDILHEKGYRQEFLCGSDADFAGRRSFFEQHGEYEIFDLYTAREKGYIAEDYHVWWGYEDKLLYEIAKDEITRLAAGEEPFNFTMLTVDTHFPDGYVCEICPDTYDAVAANVVSCADNQIAQFIDWCSTQEWYEDTVIVIVGDHPRMDTALVGEVPLEKRTMYNCIINCNAENVRRENRDCTILDLFPTVLSAIGFEIEGDRLGLGTDLLSGRETLTEELGFDYVNGELGKSSSYYLKNFN